MESSSQDVRMMAVLNTGWPECEANEDVAQWMKDQDAFTVISKTPNYKCPDGYKDMSLDRFKLNEDYAICVKNDFKHQPSPELSDRIKMCAKNSNPVGKKITMTDIFIIILALLVVGGGVWLAREKGII